MERWHNSAGREKEEKAKKMEKHREVTLMPTAYKVYAKVLAERLRKEIEEKGMLPEWQVGFRKGKEVMDNIYTPNYVVKREIARGNKIVATFV